jgi:hypothetical protein
MGREIKWLQFRIIQKEWSSFMSLTELPYHDRFHRIRHQIKILYQKIITKVMTSWTDLLDFSGQAWWVEIFTAQPYCIYYFGPFASYQEAQIAITGYRQDLEEEAAQGIQIQVKRCRPQQLTTALDAN